MNRLLAVVLAVTVSAVGTAASAQTIVSAEKPEELVAIIRELGYQAALETDGEGDPLIRSSGNGSSFSIFFYGCTDNAACKSLHFTAGYDLANGAKLETVEAWNRERRFASAYLDDEDDPFLQMDVNTEGGITQTNFEKTFELWQRLKVEFEEHIGF